MMVFNDGGSSFWQGYFLGNKASKTILNAFAEYHPRAERETGMKLVRICVDMGSEFFNDKWHEYTKTHGIIVEFSAPYAHGQNGMAERGMRIILKGTRCLLVDSGLPPSLWADAAAMVIYLRNFVPSARHPGIVPAECWTGKRQDISHLRPFGCIAYAKIPVEIGISKLSPRSIKYVLIGYFGHGAYKLWDRASGTTIKSCDVIFEEGQGHHSITVPTLSFDSTLDDGDALPPSETSNFNPSGVIVPPKPLTPRPRATDPPPHANPAQNELVKPITDTLLAMPPPVVLR